MLWFGFLFFYHRGHRGILPKRVGRSEPPLQISEKDV